MFETLRASGLRQKICVKYWPNRPKRTSGALISSSWAVASGIASIKHIQSSDSALSSTPQYIHHAQPAAAHRAIATTCTQATRGPAARAAQQAVGSHRCCGFAPPQIQVWRGRVSEEPLRAFSTGWTFTSHVIMARLSPPYRSIPGRSVGLLKQNYHKVQLFSKVLGCSIPLEMTRDTLR